MQLWRAAKAKGTALTARAVHAAIEASAWPFFTPTGARYCIAGPFRAAALVVFAPPATLKQQSGLRTGCACLLVVHNAAVAYFVGPGKLLGLALQATVVCSVGRFAVVLITTLPKQVSLQSLKRASCTFCPGIDSGAAVLAASKPSVKAACLMLAERSGVCLRATVWSADRC